MAHRYWLFVFLFLCGFVPSAFPQAVDCVDQDITDVFRKKGKLVEPEFVIVKHPSIILIPVVASSPATGFQVGAAGQAAWYNDLPENTRISQASVNLTFTSMRQVLLTAKSTIMGKQDKWIWVGDWRYYFYSQPTFGLGTNSPDSASLGFGINVGGVETETNPGEQPMDFQWIRLHETAYRAVAKSLYVGVGFHLDIYRNILDKNLDLANDRLTDHYQYSTRNRFDPNQYTLSGMSINAIFDSRDNQINPYKGYYLHLQHRFNSPAFGGSQYSETLWLEGRAYKSLSKSRPRKLLAAWVFGNFVTGGAVPYLALPGANYDMRNRSARAYAQGRFRGEDMVYGELEYRFPISSCTGVLGGVVFVNAISTSNREPAARVYTFDYIKGGYGFGLRIAADKLSRTNIAIDVGFGHNSMGIYFGAAEVF